MTQEDTSSEHILHYCTSCFEKGHRLASGRQQHNIAIRNIWQSQMLRVPLHALLACAVQGSKSGNVRTKRDRHSEAPQGEKGASGLTKGSNMSSLTLPLAQHTSKSFWCANAARRPHNVRSAMQPKLQEQLYSVHKPLKKQMAGLAPGRLLGPLCTRHAVLESCSILLKSQKSTSADVCK